MGGLFSRKPDYSKSSRNYSSSLDDEIRRINDERELRNINWQQQLQRHLEQEKRRRKKEAEEYLGQFEIVDKGLSELQIHTEVKGHSGQLKLSDGRYVTPIKDLFISFSHPTSNTWSNFDCNTVDIKFISLPVDIFEYQLIRSYFKKTTKSYFKVHSIERIENSLLYIAYLLKKAELTSRIGKEPTEMLLFHGTSASKVQNICENNFDWRKFGQNKGHKFGQGVSFSPISFYASHYSDKRVEKRVMLVAKVWIGNTITGNRNDPLPTEGYDTTTNHNGHVIVKYEDNEFYPAYKITYSGF